MTKERVNQVMHGWFAVNGIDATEQNIKIYKAGGEAFAEMLQAEIGDMALKSVPSRTRYVSAPRNDITNLWGLLP